MLPKISELKQPILMGMSFYGDPFDSHTGWDEENHIGHLWKRFLGYLQHHPEVQSRQKPSGACYEVHIYSDETREKGLFEVFVGVEIDIEDARNIPIELSVKALPRTQYAIFSFKGDQIKSDWEKLLQDWLQSSGYQCSHSFNFQYYDDRFKGLENLEESALDVYFPIEKAA